MRKLAAIGYYRQAAGNDRVFQTGCSRLPGVRQIKLLRWPHNIKAVDGNRNYSSYMSDYFCCLVPRGTSSLPPNFGDLFFGSGCRLSVRLQRPKFAWSKTWTCGLSHAKVLWQKAINLLNTWAMLLINLLSSVVYLHHTYIFAFLVGRFRHTCVAYIILKMVICRTWDCEGVWRKPGFHQLHL